MQTIIENNLFQVIDENDLDEILNEHRDNLVVIMFSSKMCTHCKKIKPKFVDLSTNNKDCLFIYIDLDNFKDTSTKYTQNIQHIPHFVYYLNNTSLSVISGANEEAISKVLVFLKDKINVKKKEILEREVSSGSNSNSKTELSKKMEALAQLKQLVHTGVVLRKQYNLNSELQDLYDELEYHLDINKDINKNIKEETKSHKSSKSSKSAEARKEKIKQLQELMKINQSLQQQQIQNTQQLRELQKIKIDQERKMF